MTALYIIIILLFGMYVYLSIVMTKLSQDNDNLKKENMHLEKRIDNLMECVRMLNKEINNKTPVITPKVKGNE